MKNPFLTKGYVTPEYFCDREQETKTILSAIDNGRDLIVYGRRRMGKSSLLWHIFHKIEKKSINIWVDMLPSKSLGDFIDYTATAILKGISEDTSVGKKLWTGMKSLRPTVSFDEFSGQPNVSFDLSKDELKVKTFADLVQLLQSTNKKVVIAFDEFQQIQSYPEKNLESQLRAILQTLPNITFIFSGSDQHMLLDMFENKGRPFYNFGQYLRLGPIDTDIYVQFILGHFERNKRKIHEALIREIIEWCSSRTFNVQVVMNRLFSLDKKKLVLKDVLSVKETILKEKDGVYYTIRRLVTPGQWRVIEAFAIEGRIESPYGKYFMKKYGFTNSSTIRRAVQTCLDNHIFYHVFDHDRSYYEIDDVFLRRWIKMYKR